MAIKLLKCMGMLIVVAGIAILTACSEDEVKIKLEPENIEPAGESSSMQYNAPLWVVYNYMNYEATIHMENGGEIIIELFHKEAPNTVNSLVFLARDGYYDGVTFHRVIPGFMAQTGDPTGTGSGGPGYSFENEFDPNLSHDGPGIVSMANRGVVDGKATNGSQFFITYAATKHLDGAHTVFGKVISGMDVVNGLSARDPATASTPGDVIRTITIEEKPLVGSGGNM